MSMKWYTFLLLLLLVKPVISTVYSCNSSSTCGCSVRSASLTRIVGGQAAEFNTWGWAVSLTIGNSLCGGSIISSSWIITAAHCVYGRNANSILVYAGSSIRASGTQIKSVQNIHIHSSYSPSSLINDIALLELTSSLNMADPYISVLCLPSVTSGATSWPSNGTTVVAVGWGRLAEGGSIATTLQQVTMQTVSFSSNTCQPLIRNENVQFCASSACKDTCQGDSGGPLMAFTASRQWVLVGLTSNGVGCARKEYAGVYTRVSSFQSWIQARISGVNNPESIILTSAIAEIDPYAVCSGKQLYLSIYLLLYGFAATVSQKL